MKEITRIHLAKVAYDIELDAKHELERYLEALGKHAEDDVIQDIESRMVELLADRGVTVGGVVTKEDVLDLKKHLGEPKDFVDPGDEAKRTSGEDGGPGEVRRLYRDMDNALLAGVLSGIAAYFHIDPVVVRIIFIILAISSFGWALLIYALLWVVVPPAKTAGQKLMMQGQPITAATIREFSEREFTNERLVAIRGFLSAAGGIGLAVASAGAFVSGVFASFRLASSGNETNLVPAGIVAFGGVVAAWLFASMSQMLFRQDFSPKQANKIAALFVILVAAVAAYALWKVILGAGVY